MREIESAKSAGGCISKSSLRALSASTVAWRIVNRDDVLV